MSNKEHDAVWYKNAIKTLLNNRTNAEKNDKTKEKEFISEKKFSYYENFYFLLSLCVVCSVQFRYDT